MGLLLLLLLLVEGRGVLVERGEGIRRVSVRVRVRVAVVDGRDHLLLWLLGVVPLLSQCVPVALSVPLLLLSGLL